MRGPLALSSSNRFERLFQGREISHDKPAENKNGSLAEAKLLTPEQVADLLNVPRSWVYGRARARDQGRLPGIRLGKYWRFREGDVLAWLDTQMQASGRGRT
jgi:excisionase family DNA binding protein